MPTQKMPARNPAAPLTVDEALRRILDGAAPGGVDSVPLLQAADRVLADPLQALRTQPPYPVSSMDGYALGEAAAPGQTFRLVGQSRAGQDFSGRVGQGETARIFTGARLPDGTDRVVAQEDSLRDGDSVQFSEDPRAGKFVRRAGLDFTAGETLLQTGLRLRPLDVALAAAMGHASLPVAPRPRVGVLASGDELARPGEAGPFDVIASNLYGVLGIIEGEGGIGIDLGIARDDAKSLSAALGRARAEKLDVLVTMGGASVGDYDLIRPVFAAEGVSYDFWKLAMRPGRPMSLGRFGETRLLGLPGNPVSALVCSLLFLRPLLRALQGMAEMLPPVETAILSAPMPTNDGRQDYVRGKLGRDASGQLTAEQWPAQDSSMLRTLTVADCLIVRAAHAPAAKPGAVVEIVRLR